MRHELNSSEVEAKLVGGRGGGRGGRHGRGNRGDHGCRQARSHRSDSEDSESLQISGKLQALAIKHAIALKEINQLTCVAKKTRKVWSVTAI